MALSVRFRNHGEPHNEIIRWLGWNWAKMLLCAWMQITNLSRMLWGEFMRKVDRELAMMIMCDRTLSNNRSVWYLVRGAIALFLTQASLSI
ncbi:hypothetical protein [Microcoleus sp. S13_B4]|uniref:hypothetical protein n=1 Tax=Microcoleus sp. S13_B4 TaxID=3055408 RepID=UPI002FCE9ABB